MSGRVFSGSISKKSTREKYIDPELRRRKWLLKYVKEEVNSVNSDFVKKKRMMKSYANSGYWLTQRFPIVHKLTQLVLSYDIRWDLI